MEELRGGTRGVEGMGGGAIGRFQVAQQAVVERFAAAQASLQRGNDVIGLPGLVPKSAGPRRAVFRQIAGCVQNT